MFNGIALQAIDTCLWQVQYQDFPASGWSSWGFPVWSSFYERYPKWAWNLCSTTTSTTSTTSFLAFHPWMVAICCHLNFLNILPISIKKNNRCRAFDPRCDDAERRDATRLWNAAVAVAAIPSAPSKRSCRPADPTGASLNRSMWRVTAVPWWCLDGALGDCGNDCGNAQKMTELQVKWMKCE